MHTLSSKILPAFLVIIGLAACDSPGGQRTTPPMASQPAGAALNGSLVGIAVPRGDANTYEARPKGGYPVATPTDRKGIVVSPYAPYHEIDVRGVAHHDLVRDPSCGRLFVQP